jgi:signal transduction histidine kinase
MARSLRGQVRRAVVLAAVVAVLLLGVPLAVVFGNLIDSRAVAGLQRDAVRGAASVPDNKLEAGVAVRLPAVTEGNKLGLYDVQGRLVSGSGPARSALAARAADGHEHNGDEAGDLAVVVPILSDTAVAGSARAAVPSSTLDGRVGQAWALLAGLAAAAIAVALLLARRSARTISLPFEQLTLAARALGEGRLEDLHALTGVAEADAPRQALEESGRQVEELLRHEREFVRDASHQLRTPLANLLLALERPEPDLAVALDQARHVATTVDDLVALRGLGATGSCDPVVTAREAVSRWSALGLDVSLRADDVGEVGLPSAALRQALDVLLDNAVRHGSEPVTVTVEPYGESTFVEVADAGPGFPLGLQYGTGLDLVTRVVERAGGTLVVRHAGPHPRVALLLPQSGS